MLKRQIAVNGDEDVDLPRRKSEQFAISNRCPTHLLCGLDLVIDDVTSQPPVDTFVEEDFHETDSISRSFACSRNAMTCSRVTDGKPSRNSSMESPASK